MATQTSERTQLAGSATTYGVFARQWSRAILSTLLVLAGLGMAVLTVFAHRARAEGLANAAAIGSLVIVVLILILVIPPLVRSARLELRMIDLPVEVTTGGMIFLSVIVVVAIAAFNTGNNLLYLVLAILVSTVFVSWLASSAALHDIAVSARFPDHIFAGEPAPVIVLVKNAKRLLPSFSLLIEARGPKNDQPMKRFARKRYRKHVLAYFAYLPHRSSAEQRVEHVFEKRGHVLVTGFEISTAHPFGFLRRRRRLRARDVDIVVYPKPEPASDELHLLPMNAGQISTARRGAGHDLFALRDYQPQDSLRHIDWKASARSQQLIVREFTAEDERRVTIHLDTRLIAAEEGNTMARFEVGVTRAASLVQHFIEEQADVRLVIGDERGRFGTGRSHLYACLRRLALVEPVEVNLEMSLERRREDATEARMIRTFGNFEILVTMAPSGSIPADLWRSSHVFFV